MQEKLFYIFALSAALTIPTVAADKFPAASTKSGVTFDKEIKPLFQKACIDCHGATKTKGGVRYDTREGALKGGKHGSGIVVGESAKSKLIADISSVDGKGPWMPPQKKSKLPPLTNEEVGLVRAWIDQGAK